jgi:hypothetical protein
MQQLLAKSGKGAVAVVADYLAQVYKHTKDELIKRYGDLFMRTTDIQCVLTVPAIWSDAAKNATLTAARSAGMGPNLTLTSEPEAAAVYTLQDIQPNRLRVGDNFVVCDAGGGTVDLISYEIKQTRPLRIEESAEGSGACCGAAMLNAKFEELIREKIGNGRFAKLHRDKARSWLTALKYFEEYVKRNFDPTSPADFNVPLPGVADDEQAGIEPGLSDIVFSEGCQDVSTHHDRHHQPRRRPDQESPEQRQGCDWCSIGGRFRTVRLSIQSTEVEVHRRTGGSSPWCQIRSPAAC